MKKYNKLKKRRILGLMLVIFALTIPCVIPCVSADNATNEQIEGLSMTFSGAGESTVVTITVDLNTVATGDPTLTVTFWIDEKNTGHLLGSTGAGGTTLETVWDITKWAEGYHVLIAELTNPTIEVTSDNKADNRLDLPFTTQDWFWAPVGDIYGFVQYSISRIARQQAAGFFAIFAEYPMWLWAIVIIVLAVVIGAIARRSRRSKIKFHAGRPGRYLKDRDYW